MIHSAPAGEKPPDRLPPNPPRRVPLAKLTALSARLRQARERAAVLRRWLEAIERQVAFLTKRAGKASELADVPLTDVERAEINEFAAALYHAHVGRHFRGRL